MRWMEFDPPHVCKAAHLAALLDFIIFNERKDNAFLKRVVADSGIFLGVEKENGDVNVPLCSLEVRDLSTTPPMECSDRYAR